MVGPTTLDALVRKWQGAIDYLTGKDLRNQFKSEMDALYADNLGEWEFIHKSYKEYYSTRFILRRVALFADIASIYFHLSADKTIGELGTAMNLLSVGVRIHDAAFTGRRKPTLEGIAYSEYAPGRYSWNDYCQAMATKGTAYHQNGSHQGYTSSRKEEPSDTKKKYQGPYEREQQVPVEIGEIPPQDILGVSQHPTKKELRKALTTIARDCHPDHHPHDIIRQNFLKEATNAYHALLKYAA